MPLTRVLLRDGLGWGFLLWLFGYILGFVFYPLVPPADIGWYVMPIGLAVTCFVLWRWVKPPLLVPAFAVGAIWLLIAIALDYGLIVRLLQPTDGYYKPDVYLYYLSALVLPPIAAFLRGRDG